MWSRIRGTRMKTENWVGGLGPPRGRAWSGRKPIPPLHTPPTPRTWGGLCRGSLTGARVEAGTDVSLRCGTVVDGLGPPLLRHRNNRRGRSGCSLSTTVNGPHPQPVPPFQSAAQQPTEKRPSRVTGLLPSVCPAGA